MWFLHNLTRLHRERLAISSLISSADWLFETDWQLDRGRLCLVAEIEVYGHRYPIKMVYPATYPASPPTVLPQNVDQRWSEHQYGTGGELCLEWGPDNWHEHITGAEILQSAYKLLEIENSAEQGAPRITAPSRHSLAIGQEIRREKLRFVNNDSLEVYLRSLPDKVSGYMQFGVVSSRTCFTVFAQSLEPSSGEKWYNQLLPSEMEKTSLQIKGWFCKAPCTAKDLTSLESGALSLILEEQGLSVSLFEESAFCLVLMVGADGHPRLFFRSDSQEWIPFLSLNVREKGAIQRLGPDFLRLVGKQVGIVGLGSAGSKIALSLARAGIRHFFLVDHDIFLPENICRHELNWEDVGQHKVDGVAHQLRLIANDMNVTCRRLMLSGQEATASVDSALLQLGECDLVMDATADPSTFNQLSSVARSDGTPLIWLEILAGGVGGVLGRYRPAFDPDPKTMRASLLSYLKGRDAPAMKAATDYAAIDAEGEIVVASDADVAVVAASATRMALDVLLEREPSMFPYSMYLLGLSRGWIFREPFDTIPIDVSSVEGTSTKTELSEKDSMDAVAFLETLITSHENKALSAT